MADSPILSLPGFRDFTPEACANRNYLYEVWRRVATRYGFVEYEAPTLESTELYLKKSGGELSTQLFRFQDQGGRDVTLRPELTASLARMAAQYDTKYPKPLKWFEIGECYRYERQQKGRLRSFIQFNADILGEAGIGADAELISLLIDTLRELGFDASQVVVRVSDRQAWLNFATAKGISEEDIPNFLGIIDKLEREKPEKTNELLARFQLTKADLDAFIAQPGNASEAFNELAAEIEARGLREFIELDLSIVRGLAYYTGVVFEVFDREKSLRAVAGGGRYDTLVGILSEGAVQTPATGFAMGDVVVSLLIEQHAESKIRLEAWKQLNRSSEIYVIIADDNKRAQALGLAQSLRDAGIRVDLPLQAAKFNKQFKQAERAQASFALIVGDEFPQVSLKHLSSRTESVLQVGDDFAAQVREAIAARAAKSLLV